jgi:23S rRNA (pseudouridine1915-N3)-methyltransferase
MRVTIIAVGRARPGPLRTLFDDYAARFTASRALGPMTLREVEERRPLAPAELKAREAALIAGAIAQGTTTVALDARGRTLTSEGFAERLGKWRDSGVADLAFIIGGAEGLDAALLKKSDFVLSLGAMTWPHMLVRAMLAEQLYRAASILQGHPYHRA